MSYYSLSWLSSAFGPGGTPGANEVLYWNGTTNKVDSSADFIFNPTLKQILLGNTAALTVVPGATAAPTFGTLYYATSSGPGSITVPANPNIGWRYTGATTETIGSGNGYIQCTGQNKSTTWLTMFGLQNSGDPITGVGGYEEISYAMYVHSGGGLYYYEKGTGGSNIGTYVNGDTLVVAIENGLVVWKKNGVVLRTSTVPPVYPVSGITHLYGVQASDARTESSYIFNNGGSLGLTVDGSAAGTVVAGGINLPTLRSTSNVFLANGTAAAPSLAFAADPDKGFFGLSSDMIYANGSSRLVDFASNDLRLAVTYPFGWTAGAATDALDTILLRDAANTLAQRNGTNPQEFRLYNTYVASPAAAEYVFHKWSNNLYQITTVATGAGTARGMRLTSANGAIDCASHFYPTVDATYDLGYLAIGYRWRQLLVGGAAATIPITVKAHASQTANLQEWQNSSGSPLSAVSATGRFGIGIAAPTANYMVDLKDTGTTAFASLNLLRDSTDAASFSTPFLSRYDSEITAGAFGGEHYAAMGEMWLRGTQNWTGNGTAAQSGAVGVLGRVEHRAGTFTVASASSFLSQAEVAAAGTWTKYAGFRVQNPAGAGTITTAVGLYINNITKGGTNYSIYSEGQKALFNAGAAGITPLVLKGASSQTANLQEWLDSADAVLLAVDKAGAIPTDFVFAGAGSGLPYGSCNGDEINWSQASMTQDTWYAISDADIADGHGGLNLITHDGSGKLTVTKAGRYLCSFGVTAEMNGANNHAKVGFLLNGSIVADGKHHLHFVTANAEQQCSGSAILALAANDYVEIGVMNPDAGTPTIVVDHMCLTLVQVGG